MTSACSRWSHPPKAAISNWNGSTGGVYAIGTDLSVRHWRDARALGSAGPFADLKIRVTYRHHSVCVALEGGVELVFPFCVPR